MDELEKICQKHDGVFLQGHRQPDPLFFLERKSYVFDDIPCRESCENTYLVGQTAVKNITDQSGSMYTELIYDEGHENAALIDDYKKFYGKEPNVRYRAAASQVFNTGGRS